MRLRVLAAAGVLVSAAVHLKLWLVLGFGISTLGGYLISATVGLFGVHEVWTGVWVITAEVSEIVAIVASVLALRRERPWHAVGQSQHRLGLGRAHLP